MPHATSLLQQRRLDRALSTTELAKAVGCTRWHIRRLETRKVVGSPELFARIAHVLGVDRSELIADAEERAA